MQQRRTARGRDHTKRHASEEHRLLAIYLQDHLALLRGAAELGGRVKAEHAEPWAREAASGFLVAVLEDRKELLRVARELDVEPSLVKEASAWLGEKVGRLKPNGRVASRSPLSILLELEAMSMLAANGEALWRALVPVARARPELGLEPTKRADAARRQQESLLALIGLASERSLARGHDVAVADDDLSRTAARDASGDAASPS